MLGLSNLFYAMILGLFALAAVTLAELGDDDQLEMMQFEENQMT